MFYPVLVFGVMIVVGLGVSWFLLPRLAQVFRSLNVDLPFLTRILIGFGEFLNRYGLVAVPIATLILIGGGFLFFRFWGDLILPFVPGIGRLIKEIELSRFGFILGSLLESGLPISDALDSLEESTSIRPYRRFYSYLGRNIKEGLSFGKSFSSYPKISRIFPLPVRHILSSAEQSGRLPETLLNIGRNYEVRVDDTAKNLTVVLEPVLLVVVWFGVLLVALAVILPIDQFGNYVEGFGFLGVVLRHLFVCFVQVFVHNANAKWEFDGRGQSQYRNSFALSSTWQ